MTKPARVEVSLVRLRTRDGVWLDGVVAEPRRRRGAALIWVHGLGSVFSSGQPLIQELSSRLNAAGIAYFKFNTRGHDIVARRGTQVAGAASARQACARDATGSRIIRAGAATERAHSGAGQRHAIVRR